MCNSKGIKIKTIKRLKEMKLCIQVSILTPESFSIRPLISKITKPLKLIYNVIEVYRTTIFKINSQIMESFETTSSPQWNSIFEPFDF
jgi:hypothetical protein